jgi:pimeloyl-ACP methyl ester carboxylesterase
MMKDVFVNPRAREKMMRSYDALVASWPVPAREHDVAGTWGSTHILETGSQARRPLVLLHGVGDNSAVMWPLNIAALSSCFHCLAIDTLGGPGKSVPNERFWRDFDQRAWLAETIGALRLDHFSVVGVSNGARMAYGLTVSAAAPVERCVCVEGGPTLGSPLVAIVSTLGMLFPEILVPTDANMKKIFAKLASPKSCFLERHPEIVDHVILAMKSHRRQAMFKHAVRRDDPEADRPSRDRLLFLFGDRILERRTRIIELMQSGGYHYAIVPNAGHGANHENPEFVDTAILSFLERRPA